MKHVYTLDDLKIGDLPKNAKLAVLGYPVSHSKSPQMHQAALDALGIEVTYIRLELKPGSLAEAFELMQQRGFIGCNVTIPHKFEARENCDEVSASVELLGVANTIHFKEGKVLGDNSDGPGLLRALEDDFQCVIAGANVLVLGAGGGAGKAIATQLNQAGCASLILSNRTVSKVEELANDLTDSGTKVSVLGNSVEELEAVAGELDIIINATSMGMKPEDAVPFPTSVIKARHKVYDAIYNPVETKLLEAAKANGAKTANGLSMLIHQGAVSFELWLGDKPDITLMREAIMTTSTN